MERDNKIGSELGGSTTTPRVIMNNRVFMKTSLLATGFVLFCLLSLTGVTQAAPIHWGPATDVFSASEVVNSGTLIEAYNAGGTTSASDQTVNGVLFTGTTSLLKLNTDADVFSEDTRDAAYNALLNSVDYGDGTDLVSLEVGGEKLTVGIEYTIQVWYAFNRGTSHTAVGDGENVPNQVELKGNPGQFAIGTFVADGSTQTITLESPMFNKCLITAYQIRGRTSAEEMIGQIQWGPATDVFSASEVINSGTLIEAFNACGKTSGSDQTVNGVLFTGSSSLLPLDTNEAFFSGKTADEGYNALLSSADSAEGNSASLEVGGGKLTVGTEYTIQLWCVDTRNKLQTSVGDGESSPNTVKLKSSPGQYAVGTFVAGGSTQTITLKSADLNSVHIAAYQIRDRVSAEEMMANFNRQLSKFPYSWDKVTRWGYVRKIKWRKWSKKEIDIMGTSCKYIWLQEDSEDCNRFKKAYPNIMYCFDSYVNLEKAYHTQKPFEPGSFLYGAKQNITKYSSGQMKYNQANPDFRRWWLDFLSKCGNDSPGSDVLFLDSLQKALRVGHADGHYYDYWGNRVSPYIGKGLIPLLSSIRDELSKDFIIQGNFLRAAGGYTEDGNFSYTRDYIDSAYLEGFEAPSAIHGTIELVQKAAALGKMIAPNFAAPIKCANIEEARKKASHAMPTFWPSLKAGDQDQLASMYSHFDFSLAYFLIMAGEHSYMRYQSGVKIKTGSDLFRVVPPFPEFDRKLGKPISDAVRISDTTWQRKFENCKVTLNVDHRLADIDWSYRSDGKYGTKNMALGKPAKQVSTFEEGVASRLVDGNTDGDPAKGSVNLTKPNRGIVWWEVDLGAIREIGKIDVWNRTGEEKSLTDFYVVVSTDPYGKSYGTNLPGATTFKVDGKCGTPSSVAVNIAGRYVRVQLDKAGGKTAQMSLAEVQVWSAPIRKNSPPVATAQSVKTGINNAKDITLSGSDVELDALTASIDTPPSHGKVTLVGNVATYQPNKDYSGPDSFTFKVKDAEFTSKAAATVSITVESLLRAHWNFDQGAGSVAKDSSVYGNDATIVDGKWVKGITGNALDLNGTSTTVTLPASTFASIGDQITIAMWVNGGDMPPRGFNILSAEDASGKVLGILLPYGSGVVYWDHGINIRPERISKAATPDQYKGAWNHWVFTKNRATGVMNIYHNGALFQTGIRKKATIGTITSASIGGSEQQRYDGAIDNVRVYKKALSAAEVKELYLKKK